ncbi:MAG: TIGR02757 family protein [Treponemataceae bacterium]|nr:TIGR02757 family protein [Treponemataceae bacterium]
MTDLKALADKYEKVSFMDTDPSQFLHWYEDRANIEIACLFAAMLSFGNRKQFIPKIKALLERADSESGSIYAWIKSTKFYSSLKELCDKEADLEKKYYRFYSFKDLIDFFSTIEKILESHSSLGDFFKEEYEKSKNENPDTDLADIISKVFENCSMVPSTKNSCKKRTYMFMRWMVRQNSPVDLGIWDWYPQSKLLIPLDTHVIQEAIKLGLLQENSKADIKIARYLTRKMEQFFPGDPARADFALFGLGVDTLKSGNF